MEQDIEAICRVVADAEELQSDVDPLVALHTPDAVIVNIAGRRVLGRDAFEEAMRAALASSLALVTTHVSVDDVRFVTPDVAIVSATKRVHDEREAPDNFELPTVGTLTYVMVRESDAWRIALAQTTPVMT